MLASAGTPTVSLNCSSLLRSSLKTWPVISLYLSSGLVHVKDGLYRAGCRPADGYRGTDGRDDLNGKLLVGGEVGRARYGYRNLKYLVVLKDTSRPPFDTEQ